MALLIDDGMVFKGEVAAEKGLPAVRFRYRPACSERVFEFYHPSNSGKESFKETTKLLRDHLVSWDVKGKDDATIPIDEKAVAKLPFSTLNRIASIIVSYSGEEELADAKN